MRGVRRKIILNAKPVTLWEPTTSLTDLLIAVVAVAGAVDLWRKATFPGLRLWAAGFFALGVSAAGGAIFHGAGPALSGVARSVLWNGLLLAAGFAGGFLVSGVVVSRVAEARARLYVGCFVLGFGALVLALRVGLHEHFNHNDLFHLLAVAALGFWWSAGRSFEEPSPLKSTPLSPARPGKGGRHPWAPAAHTKRR
ncbi:MAG: hypothetical protein Kow00109_20480 [Acidobacteriota bacterium]